MSTVTENPTRECPQTALGACPPPLAPAGPLATEEGPRAAPPRPSKSALLPQIARLALAGHSGRVIGKRLGLPRRTIARWLQELRQQWAAGAAEDAAQLVPYSSDGDFKTVQCDWKRAEMSMKTSFLGHFGHSHS